jgi:hypothetical protein
VKDSYPVSGGACLVTDADIRVWFHADIRARWQHAADEGPSGDDTPHQ